MKRDSGTTSGVRANVLWGKPGRKGLLAFLATLTLALPAAATAQLAAQKDRDKEKTFVAPGLVEGARQKPNEKIRVDRRAHV